MNINHSSNIKQRLARLGGLLVAVTLIITATGCQQPDGSDYQSQMSTRILKSTPSETALPQTADSSNPESETKQIQTIDLSHSITLEQAISYGLNENPRLNATRAAENASVESITMARSAFIPQLSAAGSYYLMKNDINMGDGPIIENSFWMAELDLNWMLWDFGRSLGQLHQASIARSIARQSTKRTEQAVIFEITNAYYSVLRNQKGVIIAQEALDAAKLQLSTANQLFAQNFVTRDDVLRAEVLVAHYEQQLIMAKNAIQLSFASLNRAMGLPIQHNTTIDERDDKIQWNQPANWAMEQAVAHRPEFEQVQLGIALEQSGRNIAKAQYMPKLFVSGAYMHIDDENNMSQDSLRGSLGIQIDLYTGGRQAAEVRQSNSRINEAIAKAQLICDTISFEVKQAYLGIEDAQARLPLAEKAMASAKENARLVLEKYKNSLARSTDLADAHAANTEAKQNYFRALYDLQLAVERLNFAMGINDKAFHTN